MIGRPAEVFENGALSVVLRFGFGRCHRELRRDRSLGARLRCHCSGFSAPSTLLTPKDPDTSRAILTLFSVKIFRHSKRMISHSEEKREPEKDAWGVLKQRRKENLGERMSKQFKNILLYKNSSSGRRVSCFYEGNYSEKIYDCRERCS
jgi:hypothetical protein